ncbi:MAG: inositol monophosphatase [Candidatus Omnitrophica bacterium]|nr:inositol monophosphatase [Candidatus Omnitrophota bacterium]
MRDNRTKPAATKPMLAAAVKAARSAGELMQRNLHAAKKVTEAVQHDIKLELDVRCQKRIGRLLLTAYPEIALLGEEGVDGDPESHYRWVVDPIDGTVNYAYGIPHACVSIALQARTRPDQPTKNAPVDFQTLIGVVYDPFREEMWTAMRGQPARLNGRTTRVSQRANLNEAVISLGFAKHEDGLRKMLPQFQQLVPRVRKIRIMGSAALDLVYVASGRMDAYLEAGVRLWDIAAGGLIVECAGGDFRWRLVSGGTLFQVVASNGKLNRQLQNFFQ